MKQTLEIILSFQSLEIETKFFFSMKDFLLYDEKTKQNAMIERKLYSFIFSIRTIILSVWPVTIRLTKIWRHPCHRI